MARRPSYGQYRDAGGNVFGRSDTIVLDTTAPEHCGRGGGHPLDGSSWHPDRST